MKTHVVFMGSPDFALPTLKILHQTNQVVGVVTQPDRPAGRGRVLQPPDVKIFAEELGLPVIQPENLIDPAAVQQIKAWSPDVIVVAAFGQILRENILKLPPFGCVNVHASLLPRWRGAAPIQSAIMYDDITGVTIMRMDKGLDTGPILSQRSIPISGSMTAGELSDILAQMGADLLAETLPSYLMGQIELQPQDHEKATYAPRIKKEDGDLDFNQSAELLARKVRAFNPWPGAFTFFKGTRLKILKAHALKIPDTVPGKRQIIAEQPVLGTIKGQLVLDRVQLAGKNRVSGSDFVHGVKDWLSEEEEV